MYIPKLFILETAKNVTWVKRFRSLTNTTEILCRKTCEQNFVKINPSVRSLSWSLTHTYIPNISFRHPKVRGYCFTHSSTERVVNHLFYFILGSQVHSWKVLGCLTTTAAVRQAMYSVNDPI